MMTQAKCHRCGLTAETSEFVCGQGDGDHNWLMFHCPQCSSEPLLTEASLPAHEIPLHFRGYGWRITLSDAMRIETFHVVDGKPGATFSNYVHPKHPFMAKPGMRELARETAADYKARSDEFSRLIRLLDPAPHAVETQAEQDARLAKVDELRKEFRVGPYQAKTVLYGGSR